MVSKKYFIESWNLNIFFTVDCINIHNAVKKLALEHNVIFRPTSQLIETEVGLRVFKYSWERIMWPYEAFILWLKV